jgi:nucleoside-diphosphate-sugar epimerase
MLGPDVELCEGDVTARDSLEVATRGVEVVFHSAGIPEQWQRDEGVFDRVNRGGTANVLDAARRAGVRRVVYTSTMDVFAAPRGGTLVETNLDPEPKPTAYERSKQAAEREAEAVAKQGLEVVYVNPGAVYGPSPVVTALNVFIVKLLKGQVPVLPPGGMPVAFVDGVAAAHVAAADRGKAGERYLVADAHLSTRELAAAVLAAQGAGKKVPGVAPAGVLKVLAGAMAPLARAFGFTPLVAPGELSFLLWDVSVDSTKAQRDLGFEPTPPAAGIPRAVEAFRGR